MFPSAIPNTPLFVKTYDFLIWLIRHTQRFPKNLRHTYTQRLEGAALDFQETILMANAERGERRGIWLARADGRLVCLRVPLRRIVASGAGVFDDDSSANCAGHHLAGCRA